MSKQIELSRRELLLITSLVAAVPLANDVVEVFSLWTKLRESLGFYPGDDVGATLKELGIDRPEIKEIKTKVWPKENREPYAVLRVK